MNPSPPIEKHVVLAGAGNAHLVALRSLAMNPQPRIAVTLVNAYPESPYSAMVPGHIGGDYTADEVSIDLAKVCHAAGARLVVGEVEGIDPVNRQVKVSGRPYLRYDALSVSLGSRPWMPPGETAGAMRPLGELVSRIERADAALRDRPGPVRWVVVGGGASGCEIALAIRKRLGVHPGFELSLVHANDRLVPGFPAKASGRLREAFEGRGVALHLGRRVTGLAGKSLQLDDGSRIPFDEVIWATSASAPDLYSESGLTTDGDGFIMVDDFLRSVSHPEVFATGDGASHRSHPALPKNGVHAVRQGKVLWANLLATLMERPLHRWNPQWATLSLLNTADGDALATWGPLTAKGSFWRRMKDRIDRRWMGMFSGLSAMPSQATDAAEPLMRCGGCGSKVSSDVLGEVLSSLDTGEDPRLLVGARDGEDASVHLMDPTLYGAAGRVVEVQTVDHFKSFIDDPYLFGRVAALHSVSDIFAMNARPFCALAIATVPHARGPVQRDLLREMLGGATRELRALRVALSGGHTTEGTELALGLAVTGHGERDTLFRKGGLRPGDKLVITKPVGTGAILAAWMRGRCRSAWLEGATKSMLLSNWKASELFARHGVAACTDVTGFGLAGHLLEMLQASGAGCRLFKGGVPVLSGFAESAAAGILSSLQPDNARQAARIESRVGAAPEWLFDPQTSGGLLAGVAPEKAEAVVRELSSTGHEHAAIIGEVEGVRAGLPPIVLMP